MNYAIEILRKEKDIIEKCLSEWELSNYPEARKERERRLASLLDSIKLLQANERTT